MIDTNTAFEKKTELLCKGLYLDKALIDHYTNQGIEIDFGRRGGAGPLGGRYFLLENQTLVNVALWDKKERTNLYLGQKDKEYFHVYDGENNEFFCKLKLVPNPKYYDPSYTTSDGIPMKKIALVHGIDCLSSTIYQRCIYWACGEACKFCGIELSLQNDTTIEEKTYSQMNEVIAVAKKEGRCNHMTLTSGTDELDDKGANRYIQMLKGIKKSYPDLPLHIQIEPLKELTYLKQLKSAGADTIGIHLEILDDDLRKEITPGKYNIPYSLFKENWKYALNIFGRNQVDSFILTGFGESIDEFSTMIEPLISIGVIPFITPVRSIPGRGALPRTNPADLIEIYRRAAQLMKQFGVNPLENKAGCVKCGGCSAIKEAYLVV
jgi:radical SAM protein (TIGR04043 family)